MPRRTNKLAEVFRTILLGLFFLLFSVASAAQDAAVQLRTVVIDPGHGGHDPGAVSRGSKLSEKQINLDIALHLGRLIERGCPDVKVIYTRRTDRFVELAERGNIANRNRADLFISIHVNSARNTSASGTETFVMGTDKSESNMEVCRRENSVIRLEDDYTTTYEGFDPDNPESYIIFNLMQNAHFEQSIAFASLVEEKFRRNGPITKSRGVRQAPLMVLWRTTMPSVLVEVGFLSNPSDRALLNQASHRQKIADNIFRAFLDFKAGYDTEQAPATLAVTPDGPHYEIQILASAKKLPEGSPEFRGERDVRCRFINGMYKYSVGNFSTKEDAMAALPEVRKKFPGAFPVKVDSE